MVGRWIKLRWPFFSASALTRLEQATSVTVARDARMMYLE